MFFLPQKGLCLFLFFLFCLLVKQTSVVFRSGLKEACAGGRGRPQDGQVLGRHELKAGAGNMGTLPGSQLKTGDRQEGGDWGTPGFCREGA